MLVVDLQVRIPIRRILPSHKGGAGRRAYGAVATLRKPQTLGGKPPSRLGVSLKRLPSSSPAHVIHQDIIDGFDYDGAHLEQQGR